MWAMLLCRVYILALGTHFNKRTLLVCIASILGPAVLSHTPGSNGPVSLRHLLATEGRHVKVDCA